MSLCHGSLHYILCDRRNHLVPEPCIFKEDPLTCVFNLPLNQNLLSDWFKSHLPDAQWRNLLTDCICACFKCQRSSSATFCSVGTTEELHLCRGSAVIPPPSVGFSHILSLLLTFTASCLGNNNPNTAAHIFSHNRSRQKSLNPLNQQVTPPPPPPPLTNLTTPLNWISGFFLKPGQD